MPEDLRQIAAATPEDIEIANMGITLQLLLNLEGESAHSTPHIRMASCDPDLHATWYRDHCRDKAFNTRDKAATSTSDQTMIRSPEASTISI